MTDDPKKSITLHATTVAINGRAALIRGASGSGKSALALELLAYGAVLVADDRTRLSIEDGVLIADAPDAIRGQIEARGVGILRTPTAGATPVKMIVDLEYSVKDRLPPLENEQILGTSLPVIKKVNAPHFNASILTYLKHGRIA